MPYTQGVSYSEQGSGPRRGLQWRSPEEWKLCSAQSADRSTGLNVEMFRGTTLEEASETEEQGRHIYFEYRRGRSAGRSSPSDDPGAVYGVMVFQKAGSNCLFGRDDGRKLGGRHGTLPSRLPVVDLTSGLLALAGEMRRLHTTLLDRVHTIASFRQAYAFYISAEDNLE